MSAWEPILVFGGAFVIACTVGLGVIALYGFFYWVGKFSYTKMQAYAHRRRESKEEINNSSMTLDEYLQQEADKHFAQRDNHDTPK